MSYESSLIIGLWLISFCYVVWETGDRTKIQFGRYLKASEDEPFLVAIREWCKALGFLAATAAAVFAFRQFDLARERADSDRRPWIGLANPSMANQEALLGSDDELSFSIASQVKNSGLSPALQIATASEIYLSETRYSGEHKGFVRYSTQREAEATKTACAQAEQSPAANSLFPNDSAPVETYSIIDSELVREYRAEFDRVGDFAHFKVVVCVAYRAAHASNFHHTSYLLYVFPNNGRAIPSATADYQNVPVSISPGISYASVAD
ncbi:hypothetical protein [Bradyrhizobium sp. CCGB01]|uniref:hypothetical protein n=1 Tax=Bradyrhizobium sp. CCGB01 TaxID=2949634 RepID=UPI0020B448A3|nr:hypothetical protein [Bradyrhizobium sp. CCGB01]MCP3405835.1 hypothetical protein [Bradyrhizobium sp. CCGB01]